ncbi:UNVERIFIED_CONTAM: hypothetical protein GTU68_021627 [Idotea baltica]|nr:hypothetical protein [Idotea baltica]
MISRVYKQACKSKKLQEVIVATDSDKILHHCVNVGINVIMTSDAHESGTDRVAEVAASKDADVIINLQGDEPFLPPDHIDRLCAIFDQKTVGIGTLLTPISERNDFESEHIVKSVIRRDRRALYFSRSGIPFHRNRDFDMPIYRHLGIYGFRKAVLGELAALDRGDLERYEMLEQLRWLEAGYDIMTTIVDSTPIGIDVPDDLNKLLAWMRANDVS